MFAFRFSQSVALPFALTCPRSGRRNNPPSLPTYTRAPSMAIECWSECVVEGQLLRAGSTDQHRKSKFQYGPIVVQCEPPSSVSYTSSSPTKTLYGAPSRHAQLASTCCPPRFGWIATSLQMLL